MERERIVSEIKTPKLSTVLKKLAVDSRLQTCVIRVDKSEDAEALLEKYNTGNRPITKAQYKLYANELLRGKWRLNGEPFIFGVDDGTSEESIISAQHRLMALINAIDIYNSTPDAETVYPDAQLFLEVAVVYSVPVETADTVDQGMLRKHGHVLFRDEWVNSHIPEEWSKNNSRKAKWCNVLAGAARLVWLRNGGASVSSAPKFVVSEMLEFIKEHHAGLCEFVSAILSASEEEGAGLKISIPYIAALTYLSSVDDEGIVDKTTKETVLDSMLKVAQNTVTVGTAEHALVSYWNKLFSAPGGKDRDLEIVGPFVKALNAIIAGEKVTAAKLALTKREQELYKTHPPLLKGWDEACFIYAAEQRANAIEAVEQAKVNAISNRQAEKAAKEAEKAEKQAAKEAEKAEKEAAKAAARAEADEAKEGIAVKPGVMSALAKTTKPMIKRKPTAPRA